MCQISVRYLMAFPCQIYLLVLTQRMEFLVIISSSFSNMPHTLLPEQVDSSDLFYSLTKMPLLLVAEYSIDLISVSSK